MKKLLSLMLLLAILLPSASGENVRGPVAAVLDPSNPNAPILIRAGDLVIIQPSANNPLHTAIKIEIAVPDAAAGMRGAYAVYLYKDVTPAPRTDIDRYRAERIDFLLLPPSRGFTIQLPYTTNFAGPESFDMLVLDDIVEHGDYPLLLAILPVMKGIPAKVAESTFGISADVVLSTMGLLELDLIFPDEERLPYAISIDGLPSRFSGNQYVLNEGIHTLKLSSAHYTDQSRTFTIKGGTHTEVSVQLESRLSHVVIEAPETAQIYLDGAPIETSDPAGVAIVPGQHTVRMKIGDYSLAKGFSVKPGMTYTVSLQMDILIESR